MSVLEILAELPHLQADERATISAKLRELDREATSLETLSGPVAQRFEQSGISEDELVEDLERAKHELRSERRSGLL